MRRDSSNVRQAFTDRLLLSEAIDAVGKMIRGYANRGSADKSYIGAIADLLCQYPRSLAIECADPVRGVVLTTKFMPTPADIAGWMEPRVDRMKGRADFEDGAERQLRERREYTERVSRPRETYDELKAKYGPNWGIAQGKPTGGFPALTLDQVREKYGATKVDAVPDAADDGWRKLKSTYGSPA
jgi:hypothetical protein